MGCGEHPKNICPTFAPYIKTHQPSSLLPALPHPPSSHLPQLWSRSISSWGAGHPHSGWPRDPHGCNTQPLVSGVRIILQPLDQSRQHVPKRPTAEHASGSPGVAEARPPHGAEHPSNGETQPGLSPQPLLALGICRERPLRMGWVSLLGDTAGMSQGGSAVPPLLGHPTPKPQNLHDPPSPQSELPQRVLHRGGSPFLVPAFAVPWGGDRKMQESPVSALKAPQQRHQLLFPSVLQNLIPKHQAWLGPWGTAGSCPP